MGDASSPAVARPPAEPQNCQPPSPDPSWAATCSACLPSPHQAWTGRGLDGAGRRRGLGKAGRGRRPRWARGPCLRRGGSCIRAAQAEEESQDLISKRRSDTRASPPGPRRGRPTQAPSGAIQSLLKGGFLLWVKKYSRVPPRPLGGSLSHPQ